MTHTIALMGKSLKPTYGETRFTCEYLVKTHTDGVANEYEVTTAVEGLHCGTPELYVCKVVALDNNRETLVVDALCDMLGWRWNGSCETELPKGV